MKELELLVLFADADAERFVTKFIRRGIERGCLRTFAWRAVRDPMHDARVAKQPTAALAPFLRLSGCRFIVMLDHDGSGEERRAGAEVERQIIEALSRAGVEPERALAIAFEPELEAALVPAWDRVITFLAQKRGELTGTFEMDPADPKESWNRALRAHRLKAGPALFEELAGTVPLSRLKAGNALGRLATQLTQWFGPLESAGD